MAKNSDSPGVRLLRKVVVLDMKPLTDRSASPL